MRTGRGYWRALGPVPGQDVGCMVLADPEGHEVCLSGSTVEPVTAG